MGIRIRLPGFVLASIGIAGMGLLYWFRPEWKMTEMAVLAAIALMGVIRTAKGS